MAERTLFLWNNDYIVRLITSSRKVVIAAAIGFIVSWNGMSRYPGIPNMRGFLPLHVLDCFGMYIYIIYIYIIIYISLFIYTHFILIVNLNLPRYDHLNKFSCISSISLS